MPPSSTEPTSRTPSTPDPSRLLPARTWQAGAPHPAEGEVMSAVTTKRSLLSHRLAPLALLSPAVVIVLVVLGYPMARQLIMSFQEFGLAQIGRAVVQGKGV